MAQIHNLTNLTNSENFVQVTQNVNQLTGELLGLLILISLFIILFVSYKGQEIATRVTAAAFITTLISFLFKLIDLTGDKVVLAFVIITALGYVYMGFVERG